MIFVLKKTGEGAAFPDNEFDRDKFDKVPIGADIKCEYVKTRNLKNHKRYFAFIKILFDSQEKFKDENVFRKYLEVRAGYGIPAVIGDVKMIMPDSIAYDRLDETEFKQVFSRVIDAALVEFPTWSRADMLDIIKNQIINFM